MAQTQALPKYIQISERLIREIAAGHLVDGARLPPEREMAQALDISVGTLRKALADLAGKGLLERVQGSGNYIRQRGDVLSVYSFFRLEVPGGGGLPSAQVLDVAQLDKPADLPPFGLHAQAHRIRRVRLLDQQPVALEEIWLDAAQASKIATTELSESLYRYYRDKLGLVIAAVEDRIGVAVMPDWGPPAFTAQTSGFITRISRNDANTAVEFSRTWFDPDRACYVSRMGRG